MARTYSHTLKPLPPLQKKLKCQVSVNRCHVANKDNGKHMQYICCYAVLEIITYESKIT